jgi:hypothetical protein
VSRWPGKHANPWLDSLYLPLAFANVNDPDAIANCHKIGSQPLSPQGAFDRAEKLAGLIAQLDREVFAERSYDDPWDGIGGNTFGSLPGNDRRSSRDWSRATSIRP